MWALGLRFALVALVFFAGYRMRDLRAQAEAGRDVTHQAQLAAQAAPIATAASTAAAETRTEIRWRTRIIQEKAHEAPPELDARFPLSHWFERMHDAAAAGYAPDPAGADATPSDVAPSQAIDVITGNYGAALECFDRLDRLQGLLANYQKIYPPAAAKP